MKKTIPENLTTGTTCETVSPAKSFPVAALLCGVILGLMLYPAFQYVGTMLFSSSSDDSVYTLANLVRTEGKTPSVSAILESGLHGAYTEDGSLVFPLSEHEIVCHCDTARGTENDDNETTITSINTGTVSFLSELPEGNLYLDEERSMLLLDYYGQVFIVRDGSDSVSWVTGRAENGALITITGNPTCIAGALAKD